MSDSESELELDSSDNESDSGIESENDFESDDEVPKSSKKHSIEPAVVKHTKNTPIKAVRSASATSATTPLKKAKIDPDSASTKVVSTSSDGVTIHSKVTPSATKTTPKTAISSAAKPTVASSSSSLASSGSSSSSNVLSDPVMFDTSNIPMSVDCTKGPVIATDAAAKKLLITYLKQQNRPYSAIQIFDNLHKRIQKPTVEKLLTALSDDANSELVCKEYGKAKIYFYNQHLLDKSLEGTCNSLEEMDQGLKVLSRGLEDLQGIHTGLKRRVDALQKEPTDAELDGRLAEMQRIVDAKRAKVAAISGHDIDEHALEKGIQLHNKYRSSWSLRKSKCMDIVDMISDGMGKSIKHVCVEVGLETDEDCGVILPRSLQEPNKSGSGSGGNSRY